jgi:hypothetical protein
MLLLLAFVLVVCLALMAASRKPERRMLGVLAKAVLVTIASWMIWSLLLFVGIVRVDPLLRWLGAYRLEQPWAGLLFLGPPALAGVAYGVIAARRSTRA